MNRMISWIGLNLSMFRMTQLNGNWIVFLDMEFVLAIASDLVKNEMNE